MKSCPINQPHCYKSCRFWTGICEHTRIMAEIREKIKQQTDKIERGFSIDPERKLSE